MEDKNLHSEDVSMRRPRRKGGLSHARSLLFRLIVIIYLIAIMVSGYWYWMRPIRRAHVHNAYNWWSELAELYSMPLPSSEKWE